MKQSKKLTLAQKKCLMAHGLNPHDWRLISETEFSYYIINKEKKTTKLVDKFRK